MITKHSNTLNTLSIAAYKSCNAKVLVLKKIADTLERAIVEVRTLDSYIKDARVCMPINGGYKFTSLEVGGFNSTLLLPELRGTDVEKLISRLNGDTVLIIPPTKQEIPSQPLLSENFVTRLDKTQTMKDKNILMLMEVDEW